MIIDENNPLVAEEIKQTHMGMVLLRVMPNGIITADQATCHEVRRMSPAERVAQGWDVHEAVLSNLPDVLPEIGVPSDAPLPAHIENPFERAPL